MKKITLGFILVLFVINLSAQSDKKETVITKFLEMPAFDISAIDPSTLELRFAAGVLEFGGVKIKEGKSKCVPQGGGLKDVIEVTTYYYEISTTEPASYLIAKNTTGDIVFAGQVSKKESNSENFGYDQCKYWIAETMKKDWVESEADYKASSIKSTNVFLQERAHEMATKNLYPLLVEEKFNVYSAKDKKFDYTQLEKARDMAISAYKKIGQSGPDAEAFENLKSAIIIWEMEAGSLNTEDKDARINKEIGRGLYENMMYAYSHLYNFQKAMEAGNKVLELFGSFSNNRTMGINRHMELLLSRKIASDINSVIVSDINKLSDIAKSSANREIKMDVLDNTQLAVLENEYNDYVNFRRMEAYQAEKKAWEEGVASGAINPYQEYVTETLTQGKMIIMNAFIGPNLTELPKEICSITDLSQVTITGKNIASIPAEIAQLENLVILNLSKNKLTSLPAEIGNLTKLKTLNLSGNIISHIPDEIKNCGSLKSVNLKGSALSTADKEKLAKLIPNAKIKY